MNPRFAALGNVLMQPHQGSATIATRKAMGQLMRDNLTRHFEGEELLTPVIGPAQRETRAGGDLSQDSVATARPSGLSLLHI